MPPAALCLTVQKANNVFTRLPVSRLALLTVSQNLLSLIAYLLLSFSDEAGSDDVVVGASEALLWATGDRMGGNMK